jgi:hypothetical protein
VTIFFDEQGDTYFVPIEGGKYLTNVQPKKLTYLVGVSDHKVRLDRLFQNTNLGNIGTESFNHGDKQKNRERLKLLISERKLLGSKIILDYNQLLFTSPSPEYEPHARTITIKVKEDSFDYDRDSEVTLTYRTCPDIATDLGVFDHTPTKKDLIARFEEKNALIKEQFEIYP